MDTDPSRYRFGRFVLDARERQLLRDGAEVRIRPKTFDTLLLLLQRHGCVVRKDDLMNGVWADTNVTEAVLTHCIAEVRRALGDEIRQPAYVKTVSRTGYKFVAAVSVEREPPLAPRTTARPPVVAQGLVSANAGGPAGSPRAATPPAPLARAIAVLPFANLTADAGNESFCDGLSEELINALTRLRRLRVVAHSSSFSFKGRDVDAREIGRQLNVGWILEGSVRAMGKRARIAVQLIDAASGYHAWSEQYDRQIEDVFAIQDEISLAAVQQMQGALDGAPRVPLVKPSTHNMEAYRLYLKGRGFWHRRHNGFLERATQCFEQAIDLDPDFALAHSGLADSLSTLGIWAFVSPASVFPRATSLAERALHLDPTLAEAHASRALIHLFHDWQWDAAGRGLARAVELNPGNALIRLWNGHYLSTVGRWQETTAEVLLAQELDPLSPVVSANVGWTFLLAHDYDRAIEELVRVLALDPRNGIAQFYLGFAYAAAGRYADGVEALRQSAEATGGMPWGNEFSACLRAMMGDRRPARDLLREAPARMGRSYVPPSAIALLHMGLGDDVATFEWLARSIEERDPLIPWMKFIPCFDHLRADPRFDAILRGIGPP
jgi:TolB-like protein/DNA-binding winged helix-turn-helix (wHTH) protein/Flp pilus assembly protein TadD